MAKGPKAQPGRRQIMSGEVRSDRMITWVKQEKGYGSFKDHEHRGSDKKTLMVISKILFYLLQDCCISETRQKHLLWQNG